MEMDHQALEENQTADRYWMRKLPDAERRAFEEHFVDCPVCLEKLETVERLRGGLRELPPGFTAEAPVSSARPISRDRFALNRARPLLAFLAAACFITATAASLFFYGEAGRARREAESSRHDSERARLRQAELEQALQKERANRALRSDAVVGALNAAPLAASVFTLNLTRGASSEPGDRVVLPESHAWVVLLFDQPDQANVRKYRVRISTAEGHPVGDPLTADVASGGMLAVSLPSSLLAAGTYRLAVEDAASGHLLATYRFRAIPKP
ncbi:MAG: hypothetical protein ABI682_12070 [Acidobacteriota bacterium]